MGRLYNKTWSLLFAPGCNGETPPPSGQTGALHSARIAIQEAVRKSTRQAEEEETGGKGKAATKRGDAEEYPYWQQCGPIS